MHKFLVEDGWAGNKVIFQFNSREGPIISLDRLWEKLTEDIPSLRVQTGFFSVPEILIFIVSDVLTGGSYSYQSFADGVNEILNEKVEIAERNAWPTILWCHDAGRRVLFCLLGEMSKARQKLWAQVPLPLCEHK